jgi:hypothetical protein
LRETNSDSFCSLTILYEKEARRKLEKTKEIRVLVRGFTGSSTTREYTIAHGLRRGGRE